MSLPIFYSTKSIKLSKIASEFDCILIREAQIEDVGMFRNAGQNRLVVYYNPKFFHQLEENLGTISAILTTPELADTIPEQLGVITSEKPMEVFVKLHEKLFSEGDFFNTAQIPTKISPTAKIHPTAQIAEFDVVIEDDVVIEPFAVIYDKTHIGARSFIGPHVTIGGPGFEMRIVDGKPHYVSHAGGVSIGEDCHIFAHASIARAVFGYPTTVGNGCKIDHFVHIAHAAQIGNNCRLVAGASIGGATRLYDNVWVGPNAVVANSLKVGENAWVAMGAAVAQDVEANRKIGGPFSRVMP